MSYSYKVHRSIDEVDAGVWRSICPAAGGKLSQDVRLIASLEKSLEGTSNFWHLVFYDGEAQPQACATLFTLKVDLAHLVERRLASMLRRLPRPLGRFRHAPVLLCGLPIDVGENALAMNPDCDSAQVLRLLDAAMTDIAKREKAQIVGIKEFTEGELPEMDRLLDHNFQRITTLRNHILWSDFPDFDSYLGALRHGYRWEAKKSLRLLDKGGATIRILRQAKEIAEAYTDDLHRLHLAVSDKAEYRLGVLPRQYFTELCRRFPGQVALILIERDSEVLGFLWTLNGAGMGYLMQAGMKYEVEDDIDLYFNLLYAGLDLSFSSGLSNIVFGQTADHTKARLGCTGFPLYAYVKGVRSPMSFIFKHFLSVLTPVMPELPHYRVFNAQESAEGQEASALPDGEAQVADSEPVGTAPAG